MDQETLKEFWAEFCFHLSDNVSPSINENVFEQKVLFALEKLLGWSQFKGEIKVKPSFQIGPQSFIKPDIVLYPPNNKAVIVLKLKWTAENLGRTGTIAQLQSYMQQLKACFGLLIGKEIHVYYDGTLNPKQDPLLLSKIQFKSDSIDGVNFVKIFNRNNFIAKKYESYLKALIHRLDQQRKINAVRDRLLSEQTSQRLLKHLQNDCSDVENQVLIEAMKGLKIKISYDQALQNFMAISPEITISTEPQTPVFVCKNKASGKYFIYIEDLINSGEARLINPDGKHVNFNPDFFEEPKDETADYLLSYNLITEIQLEKYDQYISEQSEVLDKVVNGYSDQVKIENKRYTYRTAGHKSPSPSAYEWSRRIPELSRISGLITWKAICDYLEVYVGGNSARRALKNWARENRHRWPPIPEP